MSASKYILAVAGASGDLFARKIVPALVRLETERVLEGVSIVGASRKDWSDGIFRTVVADAAKRSSLEPTNELLSKFSFVKADVTESASVEKLLQHLRELRAAHEADSVSLYLAVSPELYGKAFSAIAGALTTYPDAREWLRVVVEKPYGSDEKTARELDAIIVPALGENNVLRIDHYLSKETLQDVLALRFANRLFEAAWTSPNVSAIRVRAFETDTVGKRGQFYDKVGALRDVAQNHMLQMLAAVTMEEPQSFDAETLRSRRADLLESLRYRPGSAVLAQYAGYRNEEDVPADSSTETGFSFQLTIASSRWNGVVVDVRGGKAFDRKETYVEIEFEPSTVSFSRFTGAPGRNIVRLELFPNERVSFTVFGKEAGLGARITPREFGYSIQDASTPAQGDIAYAQTLHAAITGDASQFVGSRETYAAWKLVDAIRADATMRPGRSHPIGVDPDSVLG